MHYKMEPNVPPALHWSALLQMMSTSKAGGLHRWRKRSRSRRDGSRSAALKSIYTMTQWYCCCCCCDCIITAEFSQLSWDQDTPYAPIQVKQTAKNRVFQIPHANTMSWSRGATSDFSIWLPLLNGLHTQLLAEVLPERCSRWGELEKVIIPRRIRGLLPSYPRLHLLWEEFVSLWGGNLEKFTAIGLGGGKKKNK